MEYKTQVFLPHEADHFRTRLTHTIEVAQISRTLARNLGLNEDLTEAIALVHDVGHTPFGHSGEDVLDELLVDFGGFNHNHQSLRVVDVLEQRYPEHPGLNLSYEVREGIVKHETSVAISHPEFEPNKRPTLEASLVDEADELAYNAHDVDDGISSGLIRLDDLRDLTILEGLEAGGSSGSIFDSPMAYSDDQVRYHLVRYLIDRMATDLLNETMLRLKRYDVTDIASLRAVTEPVCVYSEEMTHHVRQLKQFLSKRLYQHPRLVEHSDRAKGILLRLFEELMAEPSLMPPRFRLMLDEDETEMVVADYIAGMTDRFAEKYFAELSE